MSVAKSERVKVIIADDHRLFREALRSILERECEVVGEVSEAEELLKSAVELRPDIVVLDLGLPGISGLDALNPLARRAPRVKVIVLTQYDDEEYVTISFSYPNVAGYVLKSDAAQDLVSAIAAARSGKRYISPSIAPVLLRSLKAKSQAKAHSSDLTPRERAVLKLVCEGATAKEIAQRLGISPKTAQIHRANLMAKLNVRSTAALVRWAIKHKIIRLD